MAGTSQATLRVWSRVHAGMVEGELEGRGCCGFECYPKGPTDRFVFRLHVELYAGPTGVVVSA